MNTTDNLKLNLPESGDYYDVEQFNENWRKIDEAMEDVGGANTEEKDALADADTIPLHDSAAALKPKKITWKNIKKVLADVFAGKTHASRHAIDGEDPITPSAIGAAALGADGKVPAGQLPDMNYAATTHASQHGSGGSDPITPASIGAAPAYTYGTADLTAGTSPLETGKLYFVYE